MAKILMLGWEYPPVVSGGLATATEGLVNGLIELGHHIVLILPYFPYLLQSDFLRIVSPENPFSPHRQDPRSRTDWQKKIRSFLQMERTQNAALQSASSWIYDSDCCPSSSMYLLKKTELSQDEKEQLETFFLLSQSQKIDKSDFQKNLREDFPNFFSNLTTDSASPKAYLLGLLALDVLRKESDFDVVHCHDWMTFQALFMIKKEFPTMKLFAHIHSTELDRSGEFGQNQKILEVEQKGLELASQVITVSVFSKKQLQEKYKISSDKIHVIYNSSNIQHATYAKKENKYFQTHPYHATVSFVGRVTFQKGPSYFVLAAKQVLEKMPMVIFKFIGCGDLTPHIKHLVCELGIEKSFRFMGFLKTEEVQRELRTSSVFVMPSVSEPFGIVALEAIAQGVPALISKQSGVSEVLNHALKVDFWDVDLLADRIISLLKYRPICEELTQNALIDLKNRTWISSAQSLVEVYHQSLP